MRLRYRKGLVMMLTSEFKRNVVSRAGLTSYEVSFHKENENCFLISISDDAATTIVRVKDFDLIITLRTLMVSVYHDGGLPASGLEILEAIREALAVEFAETGKGVIIMKS
jgi:hypothetical protein